MNDSTSDPIAALVERFPRLFHGKHPRVASSVPTGWVALLTTLLEGLDAMLDQPEAKRFHIEQIKEKFGGLRVYWSLGPEKTTVLDVTDAQSTQRLENRPKHPSPTFDRIGARVREAEAQAAGTCQRCGSAGASEGSDRGWLSTLCERCRSTTPEPKAS